MSYPMGERVRHVLATVAVSGALLTAAHIAEGLYSGPRDAMVEPTPSAPLASFASGDLVARLSVARLDLDLPVHEGIEPTTLSRSAGHVPGTPLPGEEGFRSSLIAIPRGAHGNGGAQGLRLGDRIEMRTPFGARTYCVVERRILRPRDVRGATLGKPPGKTGRVTLIMAYPADTLGPAPQRLAVVAEAV